MNEITTYHEPQAQSEAVFHTLPARFEAKKVQLGQHFDKVEELKIDADSRFFGLVGYDGLTTIIPVVGALYTVGHGLRMISIAAQSGAGFGNIIVGVILIIFDTIIGMLVGLGDIIDAFFLRSHSIYANSIQDVLTQKFVAITHAEALCQKRGYLTQEDITELENIVDRGGKTKFDAILGKAIGLAILVFILASIFG